MPLRLRRGTDAERLTVVPLEGELVYTTDTKRVFVGDGTTSGGVGVSSLGGPLNNDLILNGYNVTGTGNVNINGSIAATAFNGDFNGSVFADDSSILVDSVAGVLRGQLIGNVTGNADTATLANNVNIVANNSTFGSYRITFTDISSGSGTIQTDSGLTYNPAANSLFLSTVNANLVGNVTGNVNGIVTGGVNGYVLGDVKGSVFADDSTLLVDALAGVLRGDLITNQISSLSSNLTIGEPSTTFDVVINSTGGRGLVFEGESTGTLLGGGSCPTITVNSYNNSITNPTALTSGESLFANNIFGYDGVNPGIISSQIIFIADNNEVVAPGAVPGKILFITCPTELTFSALSFDSQGRLGVGLFDASEALDVNGNGKFSGSVEAAGFKGSVFADDSTVIVDAINSTIAVSGFIQFGSYTTSQRDALGASNGMVLYNTTSNRFQGYQNGAWINLDDGSAAP